MAITPKAHATAARICGVAARLFLEQGFEATTIAQIAGVSDVATGTVLLHFGSKSDLATAAFALSISDAVSSAVAALPEATAPVQVSHIVEYMYNWYRTHGEVAAVLLRESLFSQGSAAREYSDAVTQTVSTFQTICASHLSNAQVPAESNLEQVDPALLAEGILADYLLVLLQGLHGRFDTIDEQVGHFNELSALRWPRVNASVVSNEGGHWQI